MSTALANFAFELVNFIILAAVLAYLFFRPVRRGLDRERDERAREAAERERLLAEAQEANRAALTERRSLEQDLSLRREQAQAALQQEANESRQRARAAEAAEREVFAAQLRALREAEVLALSDDVARVAAASVDGLMRELDGPDLDRALVDGACVQLHGMPRLNGGPVVVESARPLTGELRERLVAAMGATFDERVLPELAAGVRVTTAQGQVDATAASIARRAAREVGHLAAVPPGEGAADA